VGGERYLRSGRKLVGGGGSPPCASEGERLGTVEGQKFLDAGTRDEGECSSNGDVFHINHHDLQKGRKKNPLLLYHTRPKFPNRVRACREGQRKELQYRSRKEVRRKREILRPFREEARYGGGTNKRGCLKRRVRGYNGRRSMWVASE